MGLLDARTINKWSGKGLKLVKSGRYQEALECFDKALEINPKNTNMLVSKGNMFTALNRPQEGLQSFNKALKINSQSVNGWWSKGIALSKLNHPQQALECFDKALAINPKNAGVQRSKTAELEKITTPQKEMAKAIRDPGQYKAETKIATKCAVCGTSLQPRPEDQLTRFVTMAAMMLQCSRCKKIFCGNCARMREPSGEFSVGVEFLCPRCGGLCDTM